MAMLQGLLGRLDGGGDGRPTTEPHRFGHVGIDLNLAGQLALLDELRTPRYVRLFERLRADERLSPGRRSEHYPLVRNGYFPSPDAELYAAMILREGPDRVIEIGSGFSTLVARLAIDYSGIACELHVVDPEPRIEVDHLADRVERVPVERSSLVGERPGPGSLVFIDSSHRTRTGGDGPFLYCDLLPSLPPGVLVHVHDIYLPYDYPDVYRERLYTDQYVLHALLAGNERFQVLCAPYFLSREHPEAVKRLFGRGVARRGAYQGASWWMRSR